MFEEIIKLARKHGLPVDMILNWTVLESLVSLMGLRIMETYGEEKWYAYIKELETSQGIPLSDEDLEMYKRRVRRWVEARDKFKNKK